MKTLDEIDEERRNWQERLDMEDALSLWTWQERLDMEDALSLWEHVKAWGRLRSEERAQRALARVLAHRLENRQAERRGHHGTFP